LANSLLLSLLPFASRAAASREHMRVASARAHSPCRMGRSLASRRVPASARICQHPPASASIRPAFDQQRCCEEECETGVDQRLSNSTPSPHASQRIRSTPRPPSARPVLPADTHTQTPSRNGRGE